MLLHINFKVQEVSTSYYLPHNFYDCLFLRHIFFVLFILVNGVLLYVSLIPNNNKITMDTHYDLTIKSTVYTEP